LYKRPAPIRWPTYFVPLLAYVAATFISLVASPDSTVGWHSIQQFWLFPMGLLAANFVTNEWRARTAYRLLLIAASFGALIAVVQFGFKYFHYLGTGLQPDDPTLNQRITGSLGHWMTFSGVQLLVWCSAVPALVVLGQRWLIPLSTVGTAIVLSFTRSAWISAAAGFAAIAFSLPRRILFAVLIPMIAVAFITSPLIYHRITVSFDRNLSTNYSRKEYFEVGTRMIRDHPLLGVGPQRVGDEYRNYFPETELDFYGHLHNNVIQIAAERGLLSLAAFVWFVVELYRSLIKLLRTPNSAPR
jgi:O-antigen ligase